MFKASKYYGEIWLPDNEAVKSFCVLEFIDGQVSLETNHPTGRCHKVDLLYGTFNGLGYLTFINNQVSFSSTGIIQVSKYNPKYTFTSSTHFIDPFSIKAKEFKIDNSVFNEWIRDFHSYDYLNKSVKQADKIEHKTRIEDKSLEIQIIKTAGYNSNIDSFNLINIGLVSFVSDKELNIMECMNLYKTFQKFLLFFYGKSNHFESFSIKCLTCKDWNSLYYKDSLLKDNSGNFVGLDFNDFKDDLSLLLKNWYTNEDIIFCADIVLENLLAVKVSHSRRFTNSISAFEAFSKRFGLKEQKRNFDKRLKDKSELFSEIAKINSADMSSFASKIVRSRDFYVHGNKKQTDRFSEFELLYISFLLDFIVCIGLSEELGLPAKTIEKIMQRAKSVYLDMQSVNKMLNESNLLN